jgi:hypothetical protein
MSARRVGLHRNRFHQYAWNNSGWQPGVTTILRVQDAISGSDGLVRWAAKLAAEAAFNAAKKPESPDFQNALDAALKAVDGARDRGTRVHGGIEAAINDLEHVPTPEDGALYYAFTRFLLKEKPEIHATEQMVINMTAGYGGTFDLDATVRGKRALIDVKTGKPKDSHALQLAAYAGGEWMGNSDDPEKYPLPKFEAFYVLALADEGYELIPLAVDDTAVEHFLYLTETYHRLKSWTARDEKAEAA